MAEAPIAPPQARRRIPKSLWKAAALSGVASYLDAGLLVGISVNLAIWRDSYQMSVWMAGAVSAIVTVCIAIGSLVGGRLADLFGRRRVYNLDVLCFALGAAVMALAPNATVLLVGVVIAGLAAGADLPTSLAVVSDTAPAWARGRLIGFTQVLWSLAITTATGLGFALSHAGLLGARLIIAHLAVVALVTWALRSRLKVDPELAERGPESGPVESAAAPAAGGAGARRAPLRSLADRSVLIPMIATFVFYTAWGLGANTVGQFSTYLLVTVSGASQSLATGIGLASVPLGLLLTLVFVKVADGVWRDRVFYLAAAVQVGAFVVASAGGGAVLAGMLAFLILYQLSNPLAGEAHYKVWSQLTLPAETRATTQGITYAVARGVFAAVAFVTPALLDQSPALLLWTVTGCMALSAVVGIVIIRRLVPRAPAVQAAGSTAAAEPQTAGI